MSTRIRIAAGLLVACVALAACGEGDPAVEPVESALVESAPVASAGEQLFVTNCASCHGADRLGLLAPPLIAHTLDQRTDAAIDDIVRGGISGTRMPSFGLTLDDEQIARIREHIRQPLEIAWGAERIRRSIRTYEPRGGEPLPMTTEDVTAVVERGTGNLLFLLGGQLVREVFFPNVHGGLKYLDGHLYVPARTGYVLRLDLATLEPEISVRAGVYLRNIEVLGEHVVAVNSLPPSVAILDRDLALVDLIELEDVPSAVVRYDENRLLVSFRDRPELLVVEGGKVVDTIAVPGPFRQLEVHEGLVIGSTGKDIHITDLARHATIENDAIPHLAAGAFWPDGDRLVWATPKVAGDGVTVYEIRHTSEDGPTIRRIRDLEIEALTIRGHTNVFVRGHPNHTFFVTTSGEEILVIDKKDFSVVHRTRPAPGRMPLHTEFDTAGETLFLSVYDERGGIYQYDTTDFSLRGVIPASKPAGQYNRFMKSWRKSWRTQ